MPDFDAIVIGSGAGGLSAALRLSQLSSSVLLLEAMPSFGGYLNPFSRNGYLFDTGVHYLGKLGEGQSFQLLLQLLGLDVSFIELNPDGFDRYIFPDFELRVCKGRERFQERLHRLFPDESKAIKRYFHILDSFLAAIASTKGPPKNFYGKIMYVVRNPVMARYFRSTYQQMLNSVTRNRRLQAALSAHSGNSGSPPNRASAFVGLMALDHYLEGAYYPKGGSAALRDAFVAKLTARRATLKRNAPVTRIERRGSEYVVTIASGDQFTAHTVLSDADPVITFGRLADPAIVPKPLKKKVARLKPSMGALYAFIGTSMDLSRSELSDANLIHYGYSDMNRCFDAMAARRPSDPFAYFFMTSPSIKDPEGRHAPDGHHTLQLISGFAGEHPFQAWEGTRSRQRGDAYEKLKHEIGMALVHSAERYIPALGDHLDYIEFATPLTNAYWVNSYKGANFGLEQSPAQFGPGRFYDCTSGIDGLFVVGSGAIGGGVITCIASGVWAANQAEDYLNRLPS